MKKVWSLDILVNSRAITAHNWPNAARIKVIFACFITLTHKDFACWIISDFDKVQRNFLMVSTTESLPHNSTKTKLDNMYISTARGNSIPIVASSGLKVPSS